MVDPSGARRWIVRVVVKSQMNKMGAPLRTDFGLRGADILRLNQTREGALEYRRRQGEDITVHGFRSTSRDWAAEVANAPRELAELSLAHTVGPNVEHGYARSDFLVERRALMERWSGYLCLISE